MSTYPLLPDGYAGSTWKSYSGTIAGGNLADGDPNTGIRSLAAGVFVVTLGTKTVPANEVACGVSLNVKSKKVSGSGGAAVFAAYGGVGVDVKLGPDLALPAGSSHATASGGAGQQILPQVVVDALYVGVRTSSYLAVYDLSELSLSLLTASLPQSPVIASPSGTVSDSTRPTVGWTHVDRTEVVVTNKARSGSTGTLTATNSFVAGQSLIVNIGDSNFDGPQTVLGSTGSAFTCTTNGSGTVASAPASGTAWIGDGKSQAQREVAIFTAAQLAVTGFDPATSPAVWRSTRPFTTSQVAAPDVDLANASGYRCYVRTAVSIAGEYMWSPWSYSGFTMAVTPQAAPDLTTTWDEATNRTVVAVQGHGNLLPANLANGTEANNTTDWLGINCSLTSSTAQAKSGTRSLRLSSSATGNISARTPGLTNGTPVTAGQAYTGMASFRSAAVTRSVSVDIVWYDATGSSISTSTGSTATSSTSAWTTRTVTDTAPAGAVYAAVVCRVASASGSGELHYVDEVLLAPGTVSAWTPGGLSGWELLLERSDDGGVTRTTVRTPQNLAYGSTGIAVTGAQNITVEDHEAPRGAEATYYATIVATSPSSQASDTASSTLVTTLDGTWWFKACTDPTLNSSVRVLADPTERRKEERAAFYLPGRDRAVVVHGQLYGSEWSAEVYCSTAAEWEALDALIAHQGTILIQEPFADSAGRGIQRYVDWDADAEIARGGTAAMPRRVVRVSGAETAP